MEAAHQGVANQIADKNRSDVTIVVTTGRTKGNLQNIGRPLFYQNYLSTHYSLHRDVLFDGPRRSTVLKTLFSFSSSQAHLEIDMSDKEANAFPRFVDYIYNGTAIPQEDTTLSNLVNRFEAFPSDATEVGTKVVSSTKRLSSVLDSRSGESESQKHQPPTKKAKPLMPLDATKTGSGVHSNSHSPTNQAHKSAIGRSELKPPSKKPTKVQSSTTKNHLPSSTHMLQCFQGIPELLRGMQSGCDDTKRQSEASLQALLVLPKGHERKVISIIIKAGSIPFLLQILSGDQYATLHLDAVKLLHSMAKDSECHASCLVKALVVEKMLDCQLVHGLEIRSCALKVMASIASQSEKLCGQVLNKDGCLKSALVARNRDKTWYGAILLLCQFCKFFPRRMLREDVVDGIVSGIRHSYMLMLNVGENIECGIVNRRRDIFEAATSSIASIVNATVSDKRDILLYVVSTMGEELPKADATNGDDAMRGKHMVRVLTNLVRKPFVLRHLFESIYKTAPHIPPLLWSPCKHTQVLACTLVAALAKSLRANDTRRQHDKWCREELIPPLVKLLAYEGASQVPVTMAITELIFYSNKIARAFVQENGIPSLCDLLNRRGTVTDGCKDPVAFKVHILLALQCLLEIEKGGMAAPDAGDVLHSIGANLSRVMMDTKMV